MVRILFIAIYLFICNDLFIIINSLFVGESEECYISIRDCLEKYILSKLGNYAFQSVECPEDDAFLLRRMKILSFIQTKVNTQLLFLNFILKF